MDFESRINTSTNNAELAEETTTTANQFLTLLHASCQKHDLMFIREKTSDQANLDAWFQFRCDKY